MPAEKRETTGLRSDDARLLAGPDARTRPVPPPLNTLHVGIAERRSRATPRGAGIDRAVKVIAPLVTATSEWVAADGYVERQTFAPSAGARHPLTALVLTCDVPTPTPPAAEQRHRAWAVSASVAPTLYEIEGHVAQRTALLDAVAASARLEDHPHTVIFALARFRRTLSKYPDGMSLVWRDSGVFLGYAHLLATHLGLHSSLVGAEHTTEFPLPDTPDTLIDVGAIVLAEPEHTR